jgi:hypothetical protein
MIKTFKQFINESLDRDDLRRLRELGLATIDLEQLAERFNGTVEGNVLKLETEWDMNLEDYGIDSEKYQEVTRKFWNKIMISIDFYNSTVKAEGSISQKDIDLSETFKLAEQYDRWDDEEEDDTVLEKKRLKWHDSDAPDAKGKFKELGVQKLADWLIRTRGGNMQKITGSLNQQINFNKKKNPGYAKKMESTREAVKRKLAKRKK